MSEGNIAGDQLRLLIERIERLEEEKKGVADDIKDVYLEGVATGFDRKMMRRMVIMRKLTREALQEDRSIEETYMAALGLL